IDAFLIGHDHETVQEEINGVTIAAPMKDREVVRFDIQLINKDGKWEVIHTSSTILPLKDYEPDPVTTKATEKYHNETMEFLKDSIGEATEDFHPASEVKGIPEAQVRDTALIDLINKVQLEATGADVAAAALFRSTSNLPKGELNFANVFDIYQYANTLVGVEVTGKELKAYMEWSAAYYNTYKPGDLTISFNPTIRGYAYDMFEGVDYEIDISKPVGSRITNVMYKGEPLADDTVLKLAINDYRYSGIGPDGEKLLSGTPYIESAPKALRTYIKEYIQKEGTITPVTNNNWKIIGTNWDEELRAIAVKAVNDDVLTIPKSSDGRTENVRAITEADLIHAGLHPTYKDYMAIIHTNDTHTRIEVGDGMGFARVATKVNNMRESYGEDHVLVLDAGDTLHGLPIVTTTKGEAMTKILNTIGYDAMASGNHDYNYGYERLIELDKLMGGKVLSANVVKADGTPLLTPYIIKEVAGKKVAIFGLSTQSTTYQTHPKNVAGLTFKSPSEVAGEMVKELEGKADIIIALTHLGSYEDEAVETSFDVAESVKGIDLIVDGHSHTVLPEGKKIGDTLIVQTGEYTEELGQVNFYFKEDGTFDIVPMILTKQEGMSLSEDDAVKAVIEEIKKDFEVITSEVVGQTDVKLVGEREVVRKGESNMGNLITNALLETTGADVALTNGGGIRASIENGDITKKDVITVLPFGNYGVMIEVTGQNIKDALEVGVAKYPEANGAFSHVAGMSYTFDPSKEVGSRVVEVLVGGKPLDLKATYKLATNDFIAAGGDNYTMFEGCKSLGEFSALDEIVIEYLQTKGTEGTELQNRINAVEPEVGTQPVELGQAA
ncbi:MAG: 5'-nucleotidase C-terminal domain-containing protein, partial [Candidatus Niameybacter stercoravium]|nr:5'-nucleotidase C-terminal domain-containing protein [Candidatus Niameybacter stercoravium]